VRINKGRGKMRTNKGKVQINKRQKWLQFFLSLLWYSLELLVHEEVSSTSPDLQVDLTNAFSPYPHPHTGALLTLLSGVASSSSRSMPLLDGRDCTQSRKDLKEVSDRRLSISYYVWVWVWVGVGEGVKKVGEG